MSYIDDLRQRVEAAEKRFDMTDDRNRKYGEWLIDLMNAVEETHRQKQTEIDQLKAQIERLSVENEELHRMLRVMLDTVEEGSRDRLSEAIHELDTKATMLTGAAAPVAPSEWAGQRPGEGEWPAKMWRMKRTAATNGGAASAGVTNGKHAEA